MQLLHTPYSSPPPIPLPPLPSSLSCRGRNFFGFFIFGCFLSILLILILPAHWQQPCLQWACMYFFHIRHGRVLGVGRRPLATVRFAGGLAAYAKCSQRFCIYIFLFLFLHLPLSPTYSSTAFFVAFKLGVEVKRTLGRGREVGVSWVARNKRAALSRVQQQTLLRGRGHKDGEGDWQQTGKILFAI